LLLLFWPEHGAVAAAAAAQELCRVCLRSTTLLNKIMHSTLLRDQRSSFFLFTLVTQMKAAFGVGWLQGTVGLRRLVPQG
jgi:hypothetical protein